MTSPLKLANNRRVQWAGHVILMQTTFPQKQCQIEIESTVPKLKSHVHKLFKHFTHNLKQLNPPTLMSITESVNFYLHNASQIKTKPKIHQSRRIYPSPTLDATLNTFFCKTIEQVVIWLNYTFFFLPTQTLRSTCTTLTASPPERCRIVGKQS